MESTEVAYWAAMTQVLPVVGVGLVIEARAFSRTGIFARAHVARRINSLLWLLAAIGLTVGILIALGALRRDESPGPFAGSVARVSGSYAILFTVVWPIFWLVLERNSDMVSRALAWSPSTWRLLRSLRRDMRSFEKRWVRLRVQAFKMLIELEAALVKNDLVLRRMSESAARTSELDDMIVEGQGIRRRLIEREQIVRKRWREALVTEQNFRVWSMYLADRLREAATRSNAQNRELALHVIAASMSVDGVRLPPPQPVESEPDDGGFLGRAEAPRYFTDLLEISHMITDPEEFRHLEKPHG